MPKNLTVVKQIDGPIAEDAPVRFHEINRNRLEEEWEAQPGNYRRVAEAWADAKEKLEELEDEKEVITAELDLDIRGNPTKYGLDPKKLREESIKNTILLQKEIRLITKDIIKARHNVDILKAGVTSLDHKKKALESLVVLKVNALYATPRVSKEVNHTIKEEVDSNQKRSTWKKFAKAVLTDDDD